MTVVLKKVARDSLDAIKVMRDSMSVGGSITVEGAKHALIGKKLLGMVRYKHSNRVELQFEDNLSLVLEDVEMGESQKNRLSKSREGR